MIGVEEFMNIKELHQEGHSTKAIVRLTGHARNTVRKVLRGGHTLVSKPRTRSSKLVPFHQYVKDRYETCQLSAVRLLEEIRPMGYTGSIATVRRYLRTWKPHQKRLATLTVRFETPPGHQAQADWTYCGKHPRPTGQPLALYAFVMVLSFSRMVFVKFTTSMTLPTLVACHQEAFEFFNGWPATILYDNMKQVKVSRSKWNEHFLDFAQHYNFVPKTHRPYRPRTKGKVERSVAYVKDNFLNGRSFTSVDDLNAQARHWVEQTANVRLHGTTLQRPIDLFRQETLTPYAHVKPYQSQPPVHRTVTKEAMIHFQGSRYTVPPHYTGKTVEVRARQGQILVQCGDTVITEHRQALKGGQCIVQNEHLAALWTVTHQQMGLPTKKSWELTFSEAVAHPSLQVFEEVLA